MSREEELARRLCTCLGFMVKPVIDGVIEIVVPDRSDIRYLPGSVRYRSWNDVLFGDDSMYGLCEPPVAVFPASSLEELELQLSIRGF